MKRPEEYKDGMYSESSGYQLTLPFDVGRLIPGNDKVRLFNDLINSLDLHLLYKSYRKLPKRRDADPRTMMKILAYAFSEDIHSSRDIESACLRDINFMWLLDGKSAPDHATIARFVSKHFPACGKKVFAAFVGGLREIGEISAEQIFIDGTKVEAYANRYTFIWKKSVLKRREKLLEKLPNVIQSCEKIYGIIVPDDMPLEERIETVLKFLKKKCEEDGIVFVHGKGKRKTAIQKHVETLEGGQQKLAEYEEQLRICGERNSCSKTDHDATFMHLKDDHMQNGQLKPAYNLQHGVDSQYVTWVGIFPNPTDTNTLIPFMKDMEEHLPFKYKDVCADSGYESEENYLFLEQNGQLAFIKPSNYEISKTRGFKNDIGRRENMTYDKEEDCYICAEGKKLTVSGTSNRKTRTGYVRTETIYTCNDFKGCPRKEECIHGNNCKTPMEERLKTLHVSKVMAEKRAESLERITSPRGDLLRMNRSIQAEGSFAVTMEDMDFRRCNYRGMESVLAVSILCAIAYDINKLHFKIQGRRTGQHLTPLKESA